MEAVDIAKEHITALDDDILESDRIQDHVQGKRKIVLEKLEPYLDQLPEDIPEKQGEAIAQFLPLQIYVGALNDLETSAYRRVNMKLRKKTSEVDNKTAEIITELLKVDPERRGFRPKFSEEEVNQELDEDVEAIEPVKETETRQDPNDLS